MFKNFYKNKYNSGSARPSYSGGVTLIELLVVIFIFMVISSITIFNYNKFNSSLSTKNLVDDIALSVRRAQGYAIGVRGYSDLFSYGYGIHFTANPVISDLSAGSNKSFILFANINNNETYDHNFTGCGNPTDQNECLEVLNITSSDKIFDIFVESGGSHTIINEGSLDIFFKRPNPEPTFCARDSSSGSCNFSNDISYIKIRVLNDKNPGVYKAITISNNGQISVSD